MVAVSLTATGERAGARHRGPVVEPDLDRRSCARAPPCAAAPRQLAREPARAPPRARRGRRCRGRTSSRSSATSPGRCSASTTSEPWKFARATQLARVARAEARGQLVLAGALERADRRVAERGQPLGRLRADPGDRARRRARQPPAGLLAAHRHEAPRLLEVGGDLRDQPVRPDADREPDPGARPHLGHEVAQHAQRLLGVRDVRVALVEPDLWSDGRAARRSTRPDLARLLAVGGEVGRDEDRVRAQPARLRRRGRRSRRRTARLVARRS